MPTPEDRARQIVDALHLQCGTVSHAATRDSAFLQGEFQPQTVSDQISSAVTPQQNTVQIDQKTQATTENQDALKLLEQTALTHQVEAEAAAVQKGVTNHTVVANGKWLTALAKGNLALIDPNTDYLGMLEKPNRHEGYKKIQHFNDQTSFKFDGQINGFGSSGTTSTFQVAVLKF